MLVTRLPPNEKMPEHGFLEPQIAADLSAGVAHILVEAYDGEGYVVWSRKASASV
jgi:hypothetical protein